MAHMLVVATFKLRHPVRFRILVKSDDPALESIHWIFVLRHFSEKWSQKFAELTILEAFCVRSRSVSRRQYDRGFALNEVWRIASVRFPTSNLRKATTA